jgi:hypothetical protein
MEPSTGLNPWDLPVPRRPILADFNGASMQDDANDPPDWTSMPTSKLFNGEALTIDGMGQVIENAKLSIVFSGGVPVLNTGVTVAGTSPGATSPVLAGLLTVQRTPGGNVAGDVFVWWPANVFPAPGVSPGAGINGFVPGMIASDWYTDAGSGHSGIRVVTKNTAGVLTDLPFTVSVE